MQLSLFIHAAESVECELHYPSKLCLARLTSARLIHFVNELQRFQSFVSLSACDVRGTDPVVRCKYNA